MNWSIYLRVLFNFNSVNSYGRQTYTPPTGVRSASTVDGKSLDYLSVVYTTSVLAQYPFEFGTGV